MGSKAALEPIGTSYAHKAPRVEAFFWEKLVFLTEPLRPYPNEDPNLKNSIIIARKRWNPAVLAAVPPRTTTMGPWRPRNRWRI